MSVSSRMTWSRSRPSAPHVGQKPSTCRGEASMTVTSPSATLAPVMNTPSSRVRQMTSATGQPAGAQEVDSTVGPWVEDGRFEHLHLHPRPAHDPPQLAVSDDALRTLNPEEPFKYRFISRPLATFAVFALIVGVFSAGGLSLGAAPAHAEQS